MPSPLDNGREFRSNFLPVAEPSFLEVGGPSDLGSPVGATPLGSGGAVDVVSQWFKGLDSQKASALPSGPPGHPSVEQMFASLPATMQHNVLSDSSKKPTEAEGPLQECLRAVYWNTQLLLEDRKLAHDRTDHSKKHAHELHQLLRDHMAESNRKNSENIEGHLVQRSREQSQALEEQKMRIEYLFDMQNGRVQTMIQGELRNFKVWMSQHFQNLHDHMQFVHQTVHEVKGTDFVLNDFSGDITTATTKLVPNLKHDTGENQKNFAFDNSASKYFSTGSGRNKDGARTSESSFAPRTSNDQSVQKTEIVGDTALDVIAGRLGGTGTVSSCSSVEELQKGRPEHISVSAERKYDVIQKRNPKYRGSVGRAPEDLCADAGRVFGLDRQKMRLHEQLSRMAEIERAANGETLWNYMRNALGLKPGGPPKIKTNMAEENKTLLISIVDGLKFNVLCVGVIVANCIWIGFATDQTMKAMLRVPSESAPEYFKGISRCFTIWFLFELLFRFVALRKLFWNRHDSGWNFYDTTVVLASLAEEAIDFLNFTFLRSLRVLRIARIVRIVRVLRFFTGLRVMILGVMSCGMTLFWATLCVCLLMYICAIVFLQGATAFVAAEDVFTHEVLRKHFGSLFQACYTLLLAITNGVPWEELAEELATISPVFKYLFALYVTFVMFGILNVLIGVFVHKTGETVHKDRDLAIQEEMELTKHFHIELKALFHDHGLSEDAKLSWDCLRENLERVEVQMYLQTHGLDSSEAEELFVLLDRDQNGVISLEDFVYGCQRMKTEAKAMDIVLLFEEVAHVNHTVRAYGDRQGGLARDFAVWQDRCLSAINEVRADIEEFREQGKQLHWPTQEEARDGWRKDRAETAPS